MYLLLAFTVDPSCVQHTRHDGAHRSMVWWARHISRSSGCGFAAYTDTKTGVSPQYSTLGASGFHLGFGRPTGDVQQND